MKGKFTLLLGIFMCLTLLSNAQKILMKIPAVTPTAGEEILALEFGIEAETSYLNGAGAAVGKPIPSKLTIKKRVGQSTDDFFKNIVKGTHFNYIVFEYYDKQNVLYYTITLGSATDAALQGVFLTEAKWLSPECPTCVGLEQQFSFVSKGIVMEDKITNTKLSWNIAQMTIQ
ncbi:MAG TPA: type VI secretion system tube protein Hcp [Phnomibacter sp.]|nr:type VI secretion system tube protein Hcp [Phnomibacter sp.]